MHILAHSNASDNIPPNHTMLPMSLANYVSLSLTMSQANVLARIGDYCWSDDFILFICISSYPFFYLIFAIIIL